jgi:glycosyltransferase involved in cell wall biosynthesis
VSGLCKQIQLARTYRYDVYHYYFGLPTGLLALYPRWILKKPYVISLRGSDVPGYDRTRKFLQPLHTILRPLLRYIWGHANYVIALSQSLRALAHEFSPTTDISVISNGIDSTIFPRKEPAVKIGPVRLICVCRLVQRKGLKFLIEAMRELRNDGITLEIVGAGESDNKIRDLIERLDLNQNILLTGYVPRANLANHYRGADIFVLPSISESFGQVLLEAMSCALPIVASRVGGIPETVEHGKGGLLVEPASSKDIVNAVRSLANNPAMREKMSNYNAERVREHYRWTTVASEYASLYQYAACAENRSAAASVSTE